MPATLFDTLKMDETLEADGFTDQQARAMTAALGDTATFANVATRGDVMDLGIGMKHDIDVLRSGFSAFKGETKQDFVAFKGEMKHGLLSLEQRMTISIGGMMVVLADVLSAAFHYLR